MREASVPPVNFKKAFHFLENLQKPLYWWYERRILKAVKAHGKMPRHLGIILDGNRRFARSINKEIKAGHEIGAHKAYEVLEWCLALGIPHVTLWVFSSDNKSRDPKEVTDLLELFTREAAKMVHDPRIHANKVRIKLIGQIDEFPEQTREALKQLEDATKDYQGLILHIAIGYGGREEIVGAVKRLMADKVKEGKTLAELAESLDVSHIGNYLETAGAPDPDFIIRTSGEIRLSGFLLWQSAYSEYYFCDAYWPSFRRVDFLRAIRSFQDRERRFGK